MRPMSVMRAAAGSTVATLLLAAGAIAAHADNLDVDADSLTVNAQTSIALGTVPCGTATSRTVDVWVNRNGQNTQVFKNSSTVTVTASTSSAVLGTTFAAGNTITMPSNWSAYGNNEHSPVVTATVTVTPTAAGSGSGTVTFAGSGVNSSEAAITRTVAVPVSWSAGSCAPVTTPTTTTLDCPASVTYTGAALTPCTGSTTGSAGFSTTPTLAYTANTGAGTASVTATYAGDATHEPSSASATFTVAKAPTTTTLTCSDPTYTGGPLTPCTAETTGAGTVTGSPTVEYTDNVEAGTASAVATHAGDANHTGSRAEQTFTVGQAAAVCTVTGYTGTYDGSAHGLTGDCRGLDGAVLPGLDLGGTRTDAGTTSVDWSFDGGRNYADQSGQASVDIARAPSQVTVTCPASVVFDGSAQTPCTATVTGAGGLSQGLPVEYASNTHAGTAGASAAFDGGTNHLPSTGSATFTVAKAPTTVTVTCADGAYHYTGSPVTPECSATVTGAGGLSTTAPVTFSNNTAVGTATASATYPGDANHLAGSGSTTFRILAWTLDGFYKPVDMNGVWNTVKNGSTVPLKFRVFSGSTELTSTTAVASFTAAAVSCTSGTEDAIEEVVTTSGGTSLRYDTTGTQFVQNWQTPKKSGACYRVTMTTQDGSRLQALFKLK